jgi:hypothetical protein
LREGKNDRETSRYSLQSLNMFHTPSALFTPYTFVCSVIFILTNYLYTDGCDLINRNRSPTLSRYTIQIYYYYYYYMQKERMIASTDFFSRCGKSLEDPFRPGRSTIIIGIPYFSHSIKRDCFESIK